MIRSTALAASLTLFATAALAQSDSSVAAYKDWSVFNPSDPRECYIVSPPVSSEARRNNQSVQVRRGDIRLFVTIRPDEGVNKEISYTGGYPFRDGSKVEVKIGTDSFTLETGSNESQEWAWPASPERDAEMVNAMQRGANAQLTAVSSRGTTTIDTFSLLGFSAALEQAEQLCQ